MGAKDCGNLEGFWTLGSRAPYHPNFSIVGTDLKMVLETDYQKSAGYASFNWQCHSSGASYDKKICPSKYDGSAESGCYVQSSRWQPGKEVSCSMDNAACLTTTCSADGISSFFRGDLFHVNSKHEGTFMEQLEQDIRVLKRKDTGEVLQKKQAGVQCGYEVVGNGIQINWNYADCKVAPTMKDGKIAYGITIQ